MAAMYALAMECSVLCPDDHRVQLSSAVRWQLRNTTDAGTGMGPTFGRAGCAARGPGSVVPRLHPQTRGHQGGGACACGNGGASPGRRPRPHQQGRALAARATRAPPAACSSGPRVLRISACRCSSFAPLAVPLCSTHGAQGIYIYTYHRSVKWMSRLLTMGPARLMLMSDQPILELLVRSSLLFSHLST